MTNTEIKSLTHASDILKSVDIYAIYSKIKEAMTKEGIEESVRQKVMDKCHPVIFEEVNKAQLAKDWVDTIVSDTKNNQ